MMSRPKKIIYDKELTKFVEAKPIAKGMGARIEFFFFILKEMPVGAKWLLTLFLGGVISALVSVAFSIYFNVGFVSLAEVNVFFRIQFIFNIVIVTILGIFIGLLIWESKKLR
jgi:hypothetical protein